MVAGSSSNKHHELGRSKADFVAAGSHHTVNHASVVYGSIVSDGRTDFGHPFHCDVYVRNSTMVKPGDDADKHVSPSASQATLFFEVCTACNSSMSMIFFKILCFISDHRFFPSTSSNDTRWRVAGTHMYR